MQKMPKTSQLKSKAKKHLKKSYLNMVAVCFLIAMLTSAYTPSTIFMHYHQPLPGYTTEQPLQTNKDNAEVVDETIRQVSDNNSSILHSRVKDIGSTAINVYISRQSILLSALRAANTLFEDNFKWTYIFIFIGALFTALYKFFVANVLIVGEKRFYLESWNYKDTKISKIFYLFKLRCIKNPVYIMFLKAFYNFLWSLTIIMGPVKYYEYYLIPYILAENPKISKDNAFRISKELMMGNKLKLFKIHLSFIGWRLLSLITLGLLDTLFVNPYVGLVDAEFYINLRHEFVRSRFPGYELLNDPMLERVPSEDELLISKALYDDSEGPYTKISYFEPNQYPVFLYSVQPPAKAVHPPHHENRHYDLLSCIFISFLFSVFGWAFEVIMQLTNTGTFLHLNQLAGPWIPLYGLCSIILLTTIQKVAEWPVPTFLLITSIYSVLEYLLNWLVEFELDIVLMDYSGYFMNLNGRTFLGGSVFFGLLGCAFLYYLAPKWDDFFKELPKWARITICVVICVLLVGDAVYSFLI